MEAQAHSTGRARGGNGARLQQAYSWQADQLQTEAMCIQQTTGLAKTVNYTYDR